MFEEPGDDFTKTDILVDCGVLDAFICGVEGCEKMRK